MQQNIDNLTNRTPNSHSETAGVTLHDKKSYCCFWCKKPV